MKLVLTRNDYGNDITLTFTDEDGNALNISDASSVNLVVGDLDGSTLITKSMSFVSDGSDGQVKFSFNSGDITVSGYYDAVMQVNYSDGRRSSKPFTIQFVPDL